MNLNRTFFNMTKDISDEEFDKMLDEHFSNDKSIRIGIHSKLKVHSPRSIQAKENIKKSNINTRLTDNWKTNHKKGLEKARTETDLNIRQGEGNRKRAQDTNSNWNKSLRNSFQQIGNNKTRPIFVEGNVFISITEGSKQLNCHGSTVRNRIKSNKFLDWKFITWDEYIILIGKDI